MFIPPPNPYSITGAISGVATAVRFISNKLVDMKIKENKKLVYKTIDQQTNDILIKFIINTLINLIILSVGYILYSIYKNDDSAYIYISLSIVIICLLSSFRFIKNSIIVLSNVIKFETINIREYIHKLIIFEVENEYKKLGIMENVVVFFSSKTDKDIVNEIATMEDKYMSIVFSKFILMIIFFSIYYFIYKSLFLYAINIEFANFYDPVLWAFKNIWNLFSNWNTFINLYEM